MPGRKSNVSTASNGPEDVTETPPVKATKDKEREGLSVDDLSLPKSMIARLAKGVLPANTQIHKDALLALHKSATVFVSYIASNSNDNAQAGGKKTILPQDVMAALKDAELEEFLPRLDAELKKYNEIQCDKRNAYRRKVKEEKAAATPGENDEGAEASTAVSGPGATNGDPIVLIDHGSDAAERPAKKVKGDDGEALQPDEEDADDADDVENDDTEMNQDADEQDDDAEDDDVDDEEGSDGSDDEPMEDALEHLEERGELRDEALDEPDSD
ncbi:uncharacterized protein RCC_08370 [Ramularia collo-cygni]|uniref:DNA polymerase epsilon subunit D n=1 Tax=Ramularia collo-cygni TaxID=112498 RepID=A0A2D3VAL1_9PEZI|nr:uncharacterized protein RCC_08370 [Ramularia collo-cygni]CZT22665.1 uncharacterized protein RCC_08370 [Ramularia collo-cygni]